MSAAVDICDENVVVSSPSVKRAHVDVDSKDLCVHGALTDTSDAAPLDAFAKTRTEASVSEKGVASAPSAMYVQSPEFFDTRSA